jgi:uncharacterized protein YbjT (DUF2867 family)
MKVIVFGATGSVGRLTVERLLSEGHEVTAFARRPQMLDIEHPHLKKSAGDATNAAHVASSIAGQDSVVIALGAGSSRKSLIRSEGTQTVIRAMQQSGVAQLICLTTLGAGESWQNLNFFWKRIMFGLLLRPVFLDHERQEQLVRDSGLDWTIVRPSALTDEPANQSYKVDIPASERGLALKISRTDVAGFLASCVGQSAFLHRAVGISH